MKMIKDKGIEGQDYAIIRTNWLVDQSFLLLHSKFFCYKRK